MTRSHSAYSKAICQIVRQIPVGRVVSYAAVARAAGFPNHARFVSKAMKQHSGKLPWHRVIRSDGTLAFEAGSDHYNRQMQLLASEGVRPVNGRFTLYDITPAEQLDELLWSGD
jgi:methylated-DNA-protein-cysteine methyltransferase-like protein